MTDYLDELLEQQEEEGQGELPEWRKVSGFVFAGVEQKTADTSDGELWHETWPGEMARNSDPGAGELLQVSGRSGAVGVLTEQLQQLRRAVRQAQEQGLRTAVSPQIAAQPGTGIGLHAMPLSMCRTADYAAAVDAAFQRDARRYDGPLSLL